MMAFCNIHYLRKSSRIIVIQTTSVNVLWDAIVPLSPTPTYVVCFYTPTLNKICICICTHLDRIDHLPNIEIHCLSNTSVVFLNINNKRHLSVHPKEYISFGKGVSMFFFNFLVLIPYFSV